MKLYRNKTAHICIAFFVYSVMQYKYMKLYVWGENICHVSVARDRHVLVNTYIQ